MPTDGVDPADAIDLYCDDRREEVRDATLESHRYRLTTFAEFLKEHRDVHDLADVTGRDLHAYKVHRRDEEDIKLVTLQGQFSTIRQYLKFAASIDACDPELVEKVRLPKPETRARETQLPKVRAERVLEYLDTYEYASRNHALMTMAWHTACRMGGMRALDLRDVHLEDENPHLQFRHRRDTGTPLKNGEDGERDVGLAEWAVDVLQDYQEKKRDDVQDEHGRRPFFTTKQGRLSENWLRVQFYKMTQPCLVRECPHDEERSSCEYVQNWRQWASKCPSTHAPHDVRRGSISAHLMAGWPVPKLSERVNATPRVIRKHYDVRTSREAMLSRNDYLEVSP